MGVVAVGDFDKAAVEGLTRTMSRELAAFGITHGLYQWGELFSPVQEAYLSAEGIVMLHSMHLLFLIIIRRLRFVDALRKQGMSKARAARIS